MLEALRVAIDDPHKLKEVDYSLGEICHELQSCRSPSDDDDDPSVSLRSGSNKKVGKFSVITKEMVEHAYVPTSELISPKCKMSAFTSALIEAGFSVIKSDQRKNYQLSCRPRTFVLFKSPICKIMNVPKVLMPDTSTSAEVGPESHVKCMGVYNPKDVFLLN